MSARLAFVLTVAAALWTVALVAAPAAMGHPAAAGPFAALYAIGSQICHQRAERSFEVAGLQLPVCARCLGLYVSGALGAALAWTSVPRPDRTRLSYRTVIVVAALPTAITWTLEAAGLAAIGNMGRAVAALPLGLAGGWVFVRLLRYDARLHGHEVHHRGSLAGGR